MREQCIEEYRNANITIMFVRGEKDALHLFRYWGYCF